MFELNSELQPQSFVIGPTVLTSQLADMAANLPMPTPSPPRKPLKSFKVISFDVYGTLIDFKPSIVAAFQPLISRLPDSSPYKSRMTTSNHELDPGGAKLLGLFKQHEDRL